MPLFTNYNIKNFLSAFLSRNVHCNLENMSLPRMFYSNKIWLFLSNISNDANSSHFFLTAGCKSTRLCMCMMERHARVLESLNLILNTWLFLEIRIIRVLEACLQLARDMDCQDVILEGDSLILVRALCGLSSPPSTIDSLVVGMQHVLWVSYSLCFTCKDAREQTCPYFN